MERHRRPIQWKNGKFYSKTMSCYDYCYYGCASRAHWWTSSVPDDGKQKKPLRQGPRQLFKSQRMHLLNKTLTWKRTAGSPLQNFWYMKCCREGTKEQFVPIPAFRCCLWEAQWQWPSWRHSSRDCGNYPMALCCKDNTTNSLNFWLYVQPQPLAHCSWGQK